ncbi:MAG: glycosyltransferase [Bacteroidetes bacterium]|nr:glycosyltransferase [Bacteroidota bacterium]
MLLQKSILIIVLTLYGFSMLFIFLYTLAQGHLLIAYLRQKRRNKRLKEAPLQMSGDYPLVTIQLPVFNEKYVVERLIDQICKMDYPAEKLEIQVLDDSTDESFAIAAKSIQHWAKKGIDIKHIKRKERIGFKAGALKYGLEIAKGEFIAIFDADFLPEPDFIKKAIPKFNDSKVAAVQAKWEHINENHSLLTKVQGLALNNHFTIEQTGRNSSGAFINFNGTAGIWRKSAIIDAGNWEADTLTEDLDLSYRAQLRGWKLIYLESLEVPSELPPVMSALRTQQYRWNKGGAEVARKSLFKLLRSDAPFNAKFHGIFHLLSSSVFIAILLSSIMSLPMVFLYNQGAIPTELMKWSGILLLSFFIIAITFYTANRNASDKFSSIGFILKFPLFLSMSMGLALHNGIAVMEGLAGKKTPFVRTPKFNIHSDKTSVFRNKYNSKNISVINYLEFGLFLYFSIAVAVDISLNDFGFLPFHLMLSLGYGLIFFFSFFQKVEG